MELLCGEVNFRDAMLGKLIQCQSPSNASQIIKKKGIILKKF
jgi:hypothetical protein